MIDLVHQGAGRVYCTISPLIPSRPHITKNPMQQYCLNLGVEDPGLKKDGGYEVGVVHEVTVV